MPGVERCEKIGSSFRSLESDSENTRPFHCAVGLRHRFFRDPLSPTGERWEAGRATRFSLQGEMRPIFPYRGEMGAGRAARFSLQGRDGRPVARPVSPCSYRRRDATDFSPQGEMGFPSRRGRRDAKKLDLRFGP